MKLEIILKESGNKAIEYERDFMKMKFESNHDLPSGKILSIPVCIIVAIFLFFFSDRILILNACMKYKIVRI